MTVWVLRDGQLVDRDVAPPLSPRGKRSPLPTPYTAGDIEPYRSMASGKEITSRSHRREDLKANNCREVDPSEKRGGYLNPKYERRYSKRARELARSR